jgi:hypothetical protein
MLNSLRPLPFSCTHSPDDLTGGDCHDDFCTRCLPPLQSIFERAVDHPKKSLCTAIQLEIDRISKRGHLRLFEVDSPSHRIAQSQPNSRSCVSIRRCEKSLGRTDLQYCTQYWYSRVIQYSTSMRQYSRTINDSTTIPPSSTR